MPKAANYSRAFQLKTSNSNRSDKGVWRRGGRGPQAGPRAMNLSGFAPRTSGNKNRALDSKGRARGTRARSASYKGAKSSRSRQKAALTRSH